MYNPGQIGESSITIEIIFSVENEVSRVRNTLEKYEWYKANGYNPILPLNIKEMIKTVSHVTDDDIKAAVDGEYQTGVYHEKAQELEEEWGRESRNFLRKLKALGRPLSPTYKIYLTRYGCAGSYWFPNEITVNINRDFKRGILWVIFHEMVHLTIEDLIKLHNIPHWTKERLVDLIMNKFFPDKANLQREVEKGLEISEIFEKEFPNVENVIMEVSKIK